MRDIPQAWWAFGCGSLLLVALLPLVRKLAREPRDESRCSLDGLLIAPQHQVRIVVANEKGVVQGGAANDELRSHHFCSLGCAESWIKAKRAAPLAIYVTDEPSGEEIEIHEATFVQSQVIVHTGTNDRRHVFRSFVEATSHAAAYQGRILVGDRRPFADFLADERTSELLPQRTTR